MHPKAVICTLAGCTVRGAPGICMIVNSSGSACLQYTVHGSSWKYSSLLRTRRLETRGWPVEWYSVPWDCVKDEHIEELIHAS